MKSHSIGEFRARRPITVAAAIGSTVIGLGLALIWVPQMTLALMLPAVLASLFISVFLGLGIFLLVKIARNHSTRLSFDSAGLHFGANTYRWEDIIEIGVMQKYHHRKDLYCTTQTHSHVIELPLNEGLGDTQITSLFEDLRGEVLTNHPHICLFETTDD